MAFVIVFVNTKGGVGKTTCAINVGEAFRRDGERVLLLDGDWRQGTASRWKALAEAAGRDSVTVTMAQEGLQRLIQELGSAYDVIVVDAPAYLDKTITAMVAIADLIVMPIQPSALDLWACETAIGWIEDRQMITGGTPAARFVLSRCNPNERVNREDARQVAATGIPVLHSRTTQRVHFARTLAEGQTVFDLRDDDKARSEILAIYQEIQHVRHQLH